MLTEQFQNLGIGVASIVILYLCFKLFLEALSKRDKILNEKDNAFREFVSEHNHKSVETMMNCNNSIQEATENIKKSTEIQQLMLEVLLKDKNRP
jgi:uncharacterized membrane protein YgaE (UPF0421/DUF939 family)